MKRIGSLDLIFRSKLGSCVEDLRRQWQQGHHGEYAVELGQQLVVPIADGPDPAFEPY